MRTTTVYFLTEGGEQRRIELEVRGRDPDPGEKTACVVRYGGFGDMMQVSSILPGLRDLGYHVTVNATIESVEMIERDPYVDRFLIQERGQVLNEWPHLEIWPYWTYLSSGFDRFINLSESVEGALLAMEGRPAFFWPVELRREMLGKDIMWFTHTLSRVPLPPRWAYYETEWEQKWARKQLKRMRREHGVNTLIAWVVAGSSVNKVWPYMDSVIAHFLSHYNDVGFVLLGGFAEEIGEVGWEEEPRVWCTSAKGWSVRKSMALAAQAKVVVAPETGIPMALGPRDWPAKIIFMSHSAVDQLYHHYKNTVCLRPPQSEVPCQPCHQLHHSFMYCPRDETTGVALCQARIDPGEVIKYLTAYVETGRIIHGSVG